MTLLRTIMCVALTMCVLAGCDSGSDTTTTGGGSGGSGSAGTSAGSGTDTSGATAATPAAPSTPAATPDTSTAAPAAASDPAAAAAAPTQPAGAAAAATATQAQTLLDQTVTYIKENKMDLAEKSLTQLEGLKPKLPAEYHPKIDSARKAFNAAKTGQGLKLDGLLPGAK